MRFDVWDIKNDTLRNVEPDYEKNPDTRDGPDLIWKSIKFVDLRKTVNPVIQ
jgi:hypothetical protein